MLALTVPLPPTMPKNESHFHLATEVEDTKTPWPDVTDKCVESPAVTSKPTDDRILAHE